MATELFDYYFSQDGMFVIPIEHLSADGISSAFEAELLRREAVSQAWIELFNQAFTTYRQRASELTEKAGRYWFPPRVQHVCIVTLPEYVRPYFEPFNKSSWLFYASDFESSSSTVEFAAYQFLHVERMGLLKQVVPTLFANLSYFLLLDEDQLKDFCKGCRKTVRPDANGYIDLAKAMPSVRQMHHEELKPPVLEIPGVTAIRNTGLIVPGSLQQDLQELQESWSNAAMGVFQRHRESHATPAQDGGRNICAWLAESAPPLLVTGEEGRILWDPDEPERTDGMEAALSEVTEDGAAGIQQDLEVVGFHCRRFFDCAVDPSALVDPAPYITEEGLSYIHKERKIIAYNIGPGENQGRLWQSTPPFERYMLAARTVHEWGHLCAESGWVHVPEDRKAERSGLEDSLVALLEEIYEGAPDAVRSHTSHETERLRAKSGSVGKGLLKGMLIRIEDFQANLLAYRFLRPHEMDTYVRNNVCCHWQELSTGAVYHLMARLAYEFQYLRLSRIEDPMDWFLKSTWFAEYFIKHEVITEDLFEQLVSIIGKICDCYAIDESKFDFAVLGEA